jgi:flagellar biogenesis protein FliO
MTKPRSRKSKVPNDPPVKLAVLAEEATLSTLHSSQNGFFSRAWAWLQSRQSANADARRLRVAETVSLGEKRFVAVVQVAGRDFLIAGGPSNIALLAQLDPKEPFEDVLHRTITIPGRILEKPKRKAKKKSKAKPAAKPQGAAANREFVTVAEREEEQLTGVESVATGLPKSIKPVRKQAVKPKPAAADSESAPAIPPFSLPESFRYALQNADGASLGKPANQQNGRAEAEHVGHWA